MSAACHDGVFRQHQCAAVGIPQGVAAVRSEKLAVVDGEVDEAIQHDEEGEVRPGDELRRHLVQIPDLGRVEHDAGLEAAEQEAALDRVVAGFEIRPDERVVCAGVVHLARDLRTAHLRALASPRYVCGDGHLLSPERVGPALVRSAPGFDTGIRVRF